VSATTAYAQNAGIRIAWEERGSGFPLLLVMGLGYARWGWEPVVDALAESYRVLLFDNRGIAESDAPPGPYTTAELAEDARAVLDAAGVERAHVVGSSLGGMVALELTLAHPQRVEKLVLAGSTGGGPSSVPMPEQTVKLFAEGPSLPPAEALRRFVENALGEPTPELVDRIMAHRIRTAQPFEAWSAQAAAGAAFDALDRAAAIEAPTLVLHGEGDVVVDPGNAPLLGERIRGAQVQIVPGGHIFFWEDPEAFVARVKEFLG
jgi:pimeloyl-ACP methyl ester carboxylesterase